MAERAVEYLSQPEEVRMGDQWFEIADLEHFWIRRRFEVFCRLGETPDRGARLAEIGCGNGLVQRQFEDRLDRAIDGFDLNDYALRQNVSRRSRVVCCDVLERRAELSGAYGGIVLFDVLEHIEDEDGFLGAALHMLAEGGKIFVNVPAFMSLFSRYDDAAGHLRRYDHRMLAATAERSGLALTRWTYWGLPLTPLLWLRRLRLALTASNGDTIRKGFAPPGALANRLLLAGSRCEPIPQHAYGTSLMAVLERSSGVSE